MGIKGEQKLLEILKDDMKGSLKYKECLVRALALSDVNSPNIDFVIESLFKTSK